MNLNRFFSERKINAGRVLIEEDEGEKARIATCVLLLEIAHSDEEFSDAEHDTIMGIVQKRFGVSDETARELIDRSTEERDDSVDLWRFAKEIRERYSLEEKRHVIKSIWEVVFADGTLSPHEDYLVHKLSKLLGLSHKELIEAKLHVSRKR
jgi:uncharacterized tellurite resistance protein B-like protein